MDTRTLMGDVCKYLYTPLNELMSHYSLISVEISTADSATRLPLAAAMSLARGAVSNSHYILNQT